MRAVPRLTDLDAAVGRPVRRLGGLLPGVGLCLSIGAAAVTLQGLEQRLFGHAWLESLVLAIILGAAVRTAWTPGPAWRLGIAFSARTLLEIAVVLLGASLSAAAVLAGGALLLAAIAGVVVAALGAGYLASRLLGLSPRLAVLIACGNAICGNSAIAAVAPIIDAEGEDVAAAIGFTAVLGVAVVLAMPLLGLLLRLDPVGYGLYAGLTVYAVPQVLAAAAPMGPAAVQFGTYVKLLRVLMLGPVCIVLSLLAPRLRARDARTEDAAPRRRLRLGRLIPWFVVGFLLMAGARSAGLIPEPALAPIARAAAVLTIVSMAALGLGTDVRLLAKSGPRVVAAVTLSLVALGVAAWAATALIPLP